MTTPTTFPRSACFLDPVSVKFAAEAAGGEASSKGGRRFSMEPLLSGSAIQSGYWGTLYVDLAGVEQLSRPIPALLDHDSGQRVGVVEQLKLEAGGIVATGRMIESDSAKAIIADAGSGFPWQASAHIAPISLEDVQAGAKTVVNGAEITGPATIIRRSTIREASFVAVGADPDTAAAVLSQRAALAPGTSPTMTTPQAPSAPNTPAAAPAAPAPATPVQAAAPAPSTAPATPPVQAAASTPAPAAPPVQAAADPVALERARVAAILAASIPEQAALAGSLIASGATLEAAREAIHADLRTRFAAQGVATLGALPTAAATPAPTAAPAVPANATPDVRFAAEFSANPKLAAEFANVGDYVAFRTVEEAGRIRRIAPAAQ